MMKLNLLLITTLLLTNSAHSADSKSTVYGGIKEIKTNPNREDAGDSTLQKMLSVKGVDTQYKACQDANIPLENIPKCIWEGEGSIGPLADDLKKQVQDLYASETSKDSGRAPASDSKASSNLTAKSKPIGVDYMSDPAVVALSKVFEKKLQEALLGDEAAQKDKQTVAAVDHAKFIELYKTELGKTIVNSFTSYCMEAEIDSPKETISTNCKDVKNNDIPCKLYLLSSKSDREKTIEDNVKSLKVANLQSSTDTASNIDSEKWSGCIGSVSRVCYVKDADVSGNPSELKASKTRACTIMDYVKSARKNLILAEEQNEFYKGLARDTASVGSIANIANARAVDVSDKNSMDAVTTVTSKEIEDSYEKKNKELEKEVNDCMDSSGKILDAEKCKKFIQTDAEEKKKALMEFGLRQYALEKNIDEKLNDENEVKKYLKEEGYTDDKIKTMITDDKDLETIKKEIKERYKSEREAIIASMAEKIKGKTTEKDGLDVSNANDVDKIQTIRKEISSRSDELKQLVHFNNIVSSYLEIDSGGKKSRNVASLFAELKNGSTKIKGVDENQIKEIEKNTKEAGLNQNKDKGDAATNLSVDNLNTIFKYSTEK